MKNERRTRSVARWVASLLSIPLLLSMIAMPATAIVAANTVNSRMIIDGHVKTADLADRSVTTGKIGIGAVTKNNIALKAVKSGRIADGAITTAKIRNGHIRTNNIAKGAIKSDRIADGAITAAKIRRGHVGTEEIALGAVRSGQLADGAITSAKLRNGTITDADISSNAKISALKIDEVGLNADTIDGKNASDFVGKSGSQDLAGDLTAQNFSYSAAKTGYLSIHPSALVPGDDEIKFKRGIWLNKVNGGAGDFYAPISLPNGATVVALRYSVYDTEFGHTWAALIRVSHSSMSQSTMANSGNSVTGTGWTVLTDSSIANPTVDNDNYSYVVKVRLSQAWTTLRAGNIVIKYTYTTMEK